MSGDLVDRAREVLSGDEHTLQFRLQDLATEADQAEPPTGEAADTYPDASVTNHGARTAGGNYRVMESGEIHDLECPS